MAHLATMMQGFNPLRTNDTVFQKTVAINDFYFRGPDTPYPLGHIQSQGRTHGVMAQTVVPWIPVWAYDAWVARGVDWLAMSEDLPRDDNRVTVGPDGRIRLHYRPNNLAAHARLVKETTRILHRLGFWKVMTHSHKSKNTTHQCGTLAFGTDPRTSVLDPWCRTHDVANLFVVDASFFPSSAAVNPGSDHRGAGAARGGSHHGDRTLVDWRCDESAIVQPRRHHGVRLQQVRAVLLGRVRLPARRRRRHAAGPGALVLRRRRPQPACKIGWVRVPGGAILEIFEFQPQLPPAAIPWNRVGLTHFSFNVRNTQKWYDYLVSKGVECLSKPERSPRGHTFFFARDFDGNLIEMIDLGYMHYVLQWLGPLGGFIFRRGMYKQVLRGDYESLKSDV